MSSRKWNGWCRDHFCQSSPSRPGHETAPRTVHGATDDVGVAASACLFGSMAILRGRATEFHRLAAYHAQAATHLYVERVGEVCTDGLADLRDVERVIASRGEGA